MFGEGRTISAIYQRDELLKKLDAFAQVDSSVVTDAQDRAGAMRAEIRSLTPGLRLVGIALTVQLPPNENLQLYRALKQALPGDVLVVDTGGCTTSAIWGELMSMRALGLGIRGLVVDGCVRDATAHGRLGFPVFARGVVPNNCPKEGGGIFGEPLKCGGSLVRTGDIVVGDDDGVVVVPADRLDDVIARLPAIHAREEKNLKEIKAGKLIPDWV